MPVSAPAIEAKPAARPWLSVRLTNSVMSGPGVIARMIEAMANWIRTAVSGTKDMSNTLAGVVAYSREAGATPQNPGAMLDPAVAFRLSAPLS